ncbi:MAG: hypothetical protein ACR2ND_10095 [Solirubrobacteraceae bacterium]
MGDAQRYLHGVLALPERLLTWVICGPLGHLLAGLADWLVLLARFGWAKARGRKLG